MERSLQSSWLKSENVDLSDKGTLHSYLPVYEFLFQGMTKVNLLEIGVRRGGSLLMWADYFSPDSRITGIEYKPEKLENIDIFPDNVKLIFSNGYNQGTVSKIFGAKLDIFIDDGSHKIDDMAFCIKHYLPLVKPGGYFIIEDIPASQLLRLNKLLRAVPKPDRECSAIIDRRHVMGRADDIMFVIKKQGD